MISNVDVHPGQPGHEQVSQRIFAVYESLCERAYL